MTTFCKMSLNCKIYILNTLYRFLSDTVPALIKTCQLSYLTKRKLLSVVVYQHVYQCHVAHFAKYFAGYCGYLYTN